MAFEEIAERDELVVQVARHGSAGKACQRRLEPASPAERVQGAVARDPEEPRVGIPDVPELLARAKGVVEDVLEQILGQPTISDHLHEVLADSALAAPEELVDLSREDVVPTLRDP